MPQSGSLDQVPSRKEGESERKRENLCRLARMEAHGTNSQINCNKNKHTHTQIAQTYKLKLNFQVLSTLHVIDSFRFGLCRLCHLVDVSGKRKRGGEKGEREREERTI